MRKVYAVSTGEYSDYRVRFLFCERADAEAHAAARSDGGEVEEFTLFDQGEQPSHGLRHYRSASVNLDGSVTNEWEHSSEAWEASGSSRPEVSARKHDWKDCWQVASDGFDKALVDKAFHDRVAKLKAELLGL